MLISQQILQLSTQLHTDDTLFSAEQRSAFAKPHCSTELTWMMLGHFYHLCTVKLTLLYCHYK